MARGRKPAIKRFYVYAILVGETPIYVGKGCGRRSKQSAKCHGGVDKILEWFDCEDAAFRAERKWIADLQPTENKCPGGSGGRASHLLVPRAYRGQITEAEFIKAQREHERFNRDYQRIGPRRYVARMLLKKNLTPYVSPSKIDAIRRVANGPWA